MLLKSKQNINIKYTPNIFINNNNDLMNLPIKTNILKIDKFNSDKLKIPINIQPMIKFRDKVFTILSEELIKKNNYDLSIDLDTYYNYYSTNNFVILIENNKLLIINKISVSNNIFFYNYKNFLFLITELYT